MLTLAHHGAVTGSCHELTLYGPGGATSGILVNCGLFQGDEAAGSGMCTGGRVVNYLKAMLGDARNDVLFVGYQASGTPGRDILTHGPRGGWVMLDGERYDIRARIHQVGGYSAHAGQPDLLRFVAGIPQMPAEIRLVHGDDDAKVELKRKLEEADAAQILIPEPANDRAGARPVGTPIQ